MLDVNIIKTRDGYNVEISDGNKVLSMIFGGNLDLHWNCYFIEYRDEYDFKNKSITFEITKDSYLLWELFDKLYYDIKECNVLKVDSMDLAFCDNSEEVRNIYKIYEEHNSFIKKGQVYQSLFDGKCIRWHSDDESFNELTIIPEEDKYVLKFTPGNKISYLDEHAIRFRNSGSVYEPFNVLFMELYNKITSGKYDFKQIHITEYIRSLRK